jgi:hypothetical protein
MVDPVVQGRNDSETTKAANLKPISLYSSKRIINKESGREGFDEGYGCGVACLLNAGVDKSVL